MFLAYKFHLISTKSYISISIRIHLITFQQTLFIKIPALIKSKQ